MPFNVNTFKENIASQGYLKPYNFTVDVTPPPFMQNQNLSLSSSGTDIPTNTILSNERFRIDQLVIPGISLISTDVRRYGYGATQKMPHTNMFHDSTFSVLVNRDASNWMFWHEWTRYIFEFDTNASKFPIFLTKYKDDYSTNMIITLYDDFGQIVKEIELIQAFPSSVREIPLAWNDNQNLLRIQTSITYTTMHIRDTKFKEVQYYPQGPQI